MTTPTTTATAGLDLDRLAAHLRDRCREAAVRAYEDAGIQGLCAEGRWEAAVGAIETVDLKSLLQDLVANGSGGAR
jgi:hypothetical protein